ncbi:MAG: tetratricopeptide repeat protein [Anaerolineae bacterium]|nr:tetratricopeptide repeat protein [Anaerolineae bacterium]
MKAQMLKQILSIALLFPLIEMTLTQRQITVNIRTENTTITFAIDTTIFAMGATQNLENVTKSLMTQIENNLQGEGYDVIFDADSEYPTSYNESFGFEVPTTANLNLTLEQFVNDIHVSVFPYSSPISNLSPILETKYARDSLTIFSRPATAKDIQINSDLATAIALYSIGACNLMQKYFHSVIDATGLPSTSSEETLLKSIDFYQGNCNLLAKDNQQAITQFQKALLYDGNLIGKEGTLVGSAVNLAWTYIQVGKTQDAINLMTQMVNDIESIGIGFGTQPMWLNRYVQRSEIYNLSGRYNDALNDLNTILEISSVGNQLKAYYYFMRGQTYLLLYEWDNVLADYNKALELDPTYADAYYYRGVLKYSVLQTGQSLYSEALADFQKYLELAPDGDHAADATRYATDIRTQLAALNN